MRRCEGNDAKLLRCSRCSIATYCSKECQLAHWRAGHKIQCGAYADHRKRAVSLSGNPDAWSHLMRWVTFHHPTLINAATSLYLQRKDRIPDITARYIVHLSLNYKNDPALPAQQQFELVDFCLGSRDSPRAGATYGEAFMERPVAVEIGKHEFGDQYWGTGAYILVVRFDPETTAVIPFWKHFGIDKDTAQARPACRNAICQLVENIREGRKMRFCCGKVEGLPTCCCGGWTHEIVSRRGGVTATYH
ncbi:hypothetical protein FKP32DRAFT_1577368 [Trametes sanguinea]|nr:hypothetical protein FKP32DRAFT_1577368 [Trametes sanguinea]